MDSFDETLIFSSLFGAAATEATIPTNAAVASDDSIAGPRRRPIIICIPSDTEYPTTLLYATHSPYHYPLRQVASRAVHSLPHFHPTNSRFRPMYLPFTRRPVLYPTHLFVFHGLPALFICNK
ncbi:hypothetical protein DFH06DRAFT_1486087 [Mycena polygramma]|nr:hypothetical protein DFH06DRAFT_1486087 [Mycena polygramma]